jgi:hypothetical protein
MEFMEPKDIDWSRVVSRYVRDETYEDIEAPHWADLTDPNAGRAAVDDEAWFCRPGTLPFPPARFLAPPHRRTRRRCSCCLLVGPAWFDFEEIKSKQCALIGGSRMSPVLYFLLASLGMNSLATLELCF